MKAGIYRREAEHDKFEDKKTNLSSFRAGRQTGLFKKYFFLFISIYCKEKKLQVNLAPYLLRDSLHLLKMRKESY
jgi:hypothetical protein